ncbi:MAG: hypothetical protein H9W81_05760 [Enterococcus sp.]|nr:hypothetical protein [Enterococcus sp.]
MISVEHPEAGNAEDWVAVATDYAQTHFPDWHPQMIAEFASDIDWRMEGVAITEKNMEDAYEDWISGKSPYSPHTVPLEGYDYEIWAKVNRSKSEELVNRIAHEIFHDEPWNIERFIKGYMDSLTSSYTYEEYVRKAAEQYQRGTVPYSPHWVPLPAEGLENREARGEYLKSITPNRSDFFWDLWYYSPHGYGSLEIAPEGTVED